MRSIFFTIVIASVAYAQDSMWKTISIPEICTFRIPPTLEIQAGNFKKSNDQLLKDILEVTVTPNRVVAQQKGLNDGDPVASRRYCRIIVDTEIGAKGDNANLREPLKMSALELKLLDKTLKKQIQKDAANLVDSKGLRFSILSWEPLRIVRGDEFDAILTEYTRKMNDSQAVLVRKYTIQNNDAMHRITISYTEAEKDQWAEDLNKVINTFKFTDRSGKPTSVRSASINDEVNLVSESGLTKPSVKQTSPSAYSIGNILGYAAASAFVALIGALLLYPGFKWIAKFKPKFWVSYFSVFLCFWTSWLLGYLIRMSRLGDKYSVIVAILSFVINFFIFSLIYKLLIKHPVTGAIGFGKACLVTAIQILLAVPIIVALVFILIVLR